MRVDTAVVTASAASLVASSCCPYEDDEPYQPMEWHSAAGWTGGV